MGTRRFSRGVPTIMGLLASGLTEEQILEAYPYLELDDVRAASVDAAS
jgi:uncharacterized protein (DUF433 family)